MISTGKECLMELTGEDIHKAYRRAFPGSMAPWNILQDEIQEGYSKVAQEINKIIKEKQEQSEDDQKGAK
jgi:hypothetical protein